MNLLIQNAVIYDGLGNKPYKGNVLVEGERIKKVGSAGSGETVYDAGGKILCPGFVDIHRHADVKPLSDWSAETELRQGITSLVSGNCGISLVPSAEPYKKAQADFAAAVLGKIPQGAPDSYLGYLESVGPLPLNIAQMVGTGSVRVSLKGFENTPFTPKELEATQRIIGEALAAGAPGISMGIMYTPECFTRFEEFVTLLKPLGGTGRVLTVHIRGEGDSLVESVGEAVSIAEAVGCPLEISHFKACGMKNWNRAIYKAIEVIEKARARGLDVSCDFYPYCGGSTMLTTMLPPVLCENGTEAACRALGTKEGFERFYKAVNAAYEDWDNYALSLGWDRIIVSSVALKENEPYLGKSITAAAGEFGFSCPEALAARLMYTEGGGCGIINMSMAQSDVDAIAGLPYSMLISDALYAETDTPHPRLLGAFPRFLREYAYERKVVRPEEAIRKMTSMPAERLKLSGRGRVEEGGFADLLVFDPERFTDNADFSGGSGLASGLSLALVNGEIALKNDVPTGSRSGRLLLWGEPKI